MSELQGVEKDNFYALNSAENTSQDATTKHLATIVFLSYRHSQGGIGLQTRLLSFIEDRFHPTIFTGEEAVEVKEIAKRMVTSYFMNQNIHPSLPYSWDSTNIQYEDRSKDVASDDIDSVYERATDKNITKEYSFDLGSIASGIISMDYDYLIRPKGRADSEEGVSKKTGDFPRDPFDSHFVSFGVLRKSTSSVEFDTLYSEISAPEVMKVLDLSTLNQLKFIIMKYIETHDDNNVNLQLQGYLNNLLKQINKLG